MDFTKKNTPEEIAERWKKQYYLDSVWTIVFTKKSRKSAGVIYRELVKATTLNQVDKIIGNDTWTHVNCSECNNVTRDIMAIFDVNGGEYYHMLCKDCLVKAIDLISKEK